MDWVTGVRKDTFTRWEELHNIDFDNSFIIVYKGDNPNTEVLRIMNNDARDGWITARERDQWLGKPENKWDPFTEAEITMKKD